MRQVAIGAFVLVAISFVLSIVLHHAALGWVERARRHMGNGDWGAAIQCLDRAHREDPFLVEAYLLRATAIDAYVPPPTLFVPQSGPRAYTNGDALSDVEWYLRHRPESGDAHYLRGVLLAKLGRTGPAREELGVAIPLLEDPTRAIVERAGLCLSAGDPKAAVAEISEAIERHPLEPSFYEARASYRRFASDQRGAGEDETRAEILRESKGIAREELEARVRYQADHTSISVPQNSPAMVAERARFLGRWKVVEFQAVDDPKNLTNRGFFITFDEDGYRMEIDGNIVQAARYWLDPGATPRRIDWNASVRGEERRLLGVYEFRGADLAIAMGNAGEPRRMTVSPSDFRPVEFYVLRRQPGPD